MNSLTLKTSRKRLPVQNWVPVAPQNISVAEWLGCSVPNQKVVSSSLTAAFTVWGAEL